MKAKQKQKSPAAPGGQDTGTNAIALLKADHRKVLGLFRQFKAADEADAKARLAKQICTELIVHTKIEEEIFYPACREAATDEEPLDEAQVEHDGAKVLIAGLLRSQPDSPFYDARMAVLTEYIKHHVGEEEKPGSGIFARARAAGLDMNALGQRLQERKEELVAQAESGELSPSAPRSLELQPTSINRGKEEQSTMPRQYERDRDEQGRFTGEEDERGGRGYASRSNYRERDDQGRFMSEDESGGGRSYRNEDEDYRSSRGASQGSGGRGWSGDPEGHSRASEEGWENRRGGRSSSARYEDEGDYRASRSGSPGRGQGGWFGDPENHSRASEEGWENRRGGSGFSRSSARDYDEDRYSSRESSHGSQGRGWSGDPEGHSRASEEGWDNRGGRSRSSSSRDYDEDRGRSSSGGSHGGWFGDSRGHSEASRRGWQNR